VDGRLYSRHPNTWDTRERRVQHRTLNGQSVNLSTASKKCAGAFRHALRRPTGHPVGRCRVWKTIDSRPYAAPCTLKFSHQASRSSFRSRRDQMFIEPGIPNKPLKLRRSEIFAFAEKEHIALRWSCGILSSNISINIWPLCGQGTICGNEFTDRKPLNSCYFALFRVASWIVWMFLIDAPRFSADRRR